jgi:hypothetical protein
LVDIPHNKWMMSFTVVGWNAANSDVAFFTYALIKVATGCINFTC